MHECVGVIVHMSCFVEKKDMKTDKICMITKMNRKFVNIIALVSIKQTGKISGTHANYSGTKICSTLRLGINVT